MRTIVVFSGAGLSTESGIPTFRGPDGLWENHKVEDVADHAAWWKNKEMVLRFYAERWEKYHDCKPNEAHKAFARLEERFHVQHITQNIDSLLEQAGCKNVRHLHGRLDQAKCERHRDITNLDGDTNFTCTFKTRLREPIKMGETCPLCNGQMRPDVVFFGEAVDMPYDMMRGYVETVKYHNGVFICCGTSVQVYPAGYLVSFFSQVKNKYIVDIKPQKVADYVLVEGKASEKLPELADQLLTMDELDVTIL
jgi:NAD-dependent deacetylase